MEFGKTHLAAQHTAVGASIGLSDSTQQMGKTAQLLLAQHASGQTAIPPRALERHEASIALLTELIRSAAHPAAEAVWRNTCGWLVARNARLHVITPLTNNYPRHLGKSGSDSGFNGAHFGIDSEVPLGGGAPLQRTSATSAIVPLAQRGFAETGKIAIVDPIAIADREQIKRIISYEIQLVAAHQPPTADAEERYQSEFSMRWAAGYHSDKSDKPGSGDAIVLRDGKAVRGWHNARQAAIFADLYNSSDFVAVAWSGWLATHFQKVVLRITGPQGKNLVNSVRIDDFYLALIKDPVDTKEVNDASSALSPEDREAIRNPVGGMVNVWHDILRDADLPSDDRTRIANDLGIYGFSR